MIDTNIIIPIINNRIYTMLYAMKSINAMNNIIPRMPNKKYLIICILKSTFN